MKNLNKFLVVSASIIMLFAVFIFTGCKNNSNNKNIKLDIQDANSYYTKLYTSLNDFIDENITTNEDKTTITDYLESMNGVFIETKYLYTTSEFSSYSEELFTNENNTITLNSNSDKVIIKMNSDKSRFYFSIEFEKGIVLIESILTDETSYRVQIVSGGNDSYLIIKFIYRGLTGSYIIEEKNSYTSLFNIEDLSDFVV